jgi:transposase-like protein
MEITCPQCGSSHELEEESFSQRDPGEAKCKVCGYVLKQWRGSRVYWVRLKKREKWPKE